MAYYRSYGMGPNAHDTNQFGMGVKSPYSPPNNGGPGNPGTANNMPKPILPSFQQFQNNKGPAPLTPQDRATQYFQSVMGGAGPSSGQMNTAPGTQWSRGNQAPPGYYEQGQQALQQQWNSLPPEERARYDQAIQQRMGGNAGINPQPYGFGQGGAPTMGTYSPSVQMNQSQAPLAQHLSGLSPVQTGGSAQFNRGYSGDTMQGRQDAWQNQQQAPRQDNYYRRPNTGGDPFNQYGYAGQSQQLGRYVPPMMGNVNDMNSWQGGGGYAYNIPNSYGSGQWNQFNSRDVAFPQFGQSQNVPTPRLNPGTPPPSYQSPFGRPDPMRQQNYLAYMMNLGQGGQAQSNSTQPGAPDQPPPVM